MTEQRMLPRIIAHRGDLTKGIENTMEALNGALECADGVEIDIRMTSDQHLIVFHDDSLKRLAPKEYERLGKRKIHDLTLSEIQSVQMPKDGNLLGPFPKGGYPVETMPLLKKYRTGNGHGETSGIVTFAQFCAWLKQTPENFFAEVEYKEKDLVEASLATMKEYDVLHKCILFSGDRAVIQQLQTWFKEHEKPDGLRLGANIRFLNKETMAMIQNMDLYEAGLNGGMYANHDVLWLKEHGIVTFSNLLDVPSWWEKLAGSETACFKTNCARTVHDYFENMW